MKRISSLSVLYGISPAGTGALIIALVSLLFVHVQGEDNAADFFYVSSKQPKKGTNWYEAETSLTEKQFSERRIDSLTRHYGVHLPRDSGAAHTHPLASIYEKCVYEVRWLFMSAGYGILAIAPDPSRDLISLTGIALSHKFLGALYRVEDYARSLVHPRHLYPFFFEEHIKEGGYTATRWKLYDHYRQNVYAQKKKKSSDSVPRFVHNYLSAFYKYRAGDISIGDTVFMNSYVQGKTYQMYFTCIKRESITVGDTSFSCFLVRPDLKGKAMVFREQDRIDIWLTDNRFHMPVLVEAHIIFGKITCRLLYAKRWEPAN